MINEFKLRVGDICFSIDSVDNQFIEKLKTTFMPFTDSSPSDITVHVKFIALTEGNTLEEEIRNVPGTFNCWKEIKGLEDMTDGYYCQHDKNIYVVFKEICALFPRFYLFPLLVRTYNSCTKEKDALDGAFHIFLHAAGIIRDGQGYLFTGPSGSGKTTVSQLSANRWIVIHDEMVLLSRREGDYQLSGSPLKASLCSSEDLKAPVNTVFFLKPSGFTSLRRIRGGEAVLKLAPLLALPNDHSLSEFENLSQRLSTASILANELQCYDMHFEKNDRFWNHIDKLGSPLIDKEIENGHALKICSQA